MDDEQFSEELTDLLSKLKKGHSWDAERDIFMAAADKSGKIRKKEFADLMKGRD